MIQDLVCSGKFNSDLAFAGTVVAIYVSEFFLGKTKLVSANSTIQLVFDLLKQLITKVSSKKE